MNFNNKLNQLENDNQALKKKLHEQSVQTFEKNQMFNQMSQLMHSFNSKEESNSMNDSK